MKFIRILALLAVAIGLSACASKFRTYNGPEVTRVIVEKNTRKMWLLHNDEVLKQYSIHLGFSPQKHKTTEGDGKTPEGNYIIDRRNPNSRFHLSLGINYPNEADIAQARERGVSPGGDIFIHGRPRPWRNGEDDWTWGCIAVTDREMEDIYAMVKNGTPITILP